MGSRCAGARQRRGSWRTVLTDAAWPLLLLVLVGWFLILASAVAKPCLDCPHTGRYSGDYCTTSVGRIFMNVIAGIDVALIVIALVTWLLFGFVRIWRRLRRLSC